MKQKLIGICLMEPTPEELYDDLSIRYDQLCAKLFNFRDAVINGHQT